MKTSSPTVLLGVALFFTAGAHCAHADEQANSAIQPAQLRAHLEFLADDLLEGREAGTRGYDLAALYVGSQFRALGLEPAGAKEYFQPVPLRRAVLVPGSVSLQVAGPKGSVTFTDADHVVAYPSEFEAEQIIEAGLVFAGHGVVSPEHRRDDYAGLDVRGKFVVLLGGPPPGLPAEAAAHLGSTASQSTRAAERGAIGALIIYTPALENRFPFARMPPVTQQPRLRWFDPETSRNDETAIRATAFVDETAAEALFAGAPRSYRQVLQQSAARPVAGFRLPGTVKFTRRATLSDSKSDNVVARLRGSDPQLADEVIVVTSHLDHVGVGVPVNGDNIYNGALDNASGIAAMIEVARTLRDARPKRSVLFVAVTAEEKGLVGSDYFARNPTVPRQHIVGVINIDGVLPFYDFTSVIGYGVDSSTLREPLDRAARSLNVALLPDPEPSQSIFTRSDHYSFVKQGVPAIFLLMGDGKAADGSSGLELSRRWSAAHLHLPSDDLQQPFDYQVFARFAELFRRFTLEAANMPERPRWYAGDFFGEQFAPDAERAAR